MPPLPGPDWIAPTYGPLEPLQVQHIDPRLFTTLGITSRAGYAPLLSQLVIPVVSLPLPTDDEGVQSQLFADEVTAAGEAFIARSTAGPVAAQNSIVQLFNPAASGRILYVDAINFNDRSAADSVEMRRHGAALVVLISTGENNKSLGGAPGVAQLRAGASAAGAGTVVAEYAVNPAGQTVRVVFSPPIRIPEGFGLHITSFTVNHLLVATFEWREKLSTV